MSTVRPSHLWELIGICLMCVQQAEHMLGMAAKSVLKNPKLILMEQTEAEQRRTLNDLLRELKTQVRLERDFKERLYRFRDMRNRFVHNLHEVPGWNWQTEEGQEVALKFVVELIFLSQGISCIFAAVLGIAFREELGEELADANDTLKMVEKWFGPRARKILKGRSWPPLQPPTSHKLVR